MTTPAPMPRWYDIPLLWLGWQLAAAIAIVGVRLRRQLQARDEGNSR